MAEFYVLEEEHMHGQTQGDQTAGYFDDVHRI